MTRPLWRRPWPWIGVVLSVQAVILVVSSVRVYRSDNLSLDYAIFNQAWFQIAHGHLNPLSTPYGTSYLHQHGEIIMWLIAPLYWLNRNDGLTLLLLQSLAIVGAVAVAISWFLAFARRHGLSARTTGLCVGVMITLCVVHPWIYAVPFEDFHFEAIAVLLAVAAGRDLYVGRRARAAVWVVLGLMTGDVAATYVAAVGLALAVAARGSRRSGLVMGAAGLLWVVLLGAVGANTGSPVAGYAYLAGRSGVRSGPGGMLDIVKGTLLHLDRPVHQLVVADRGIGHNLVPSGTVGVLDPLMVIPVLAVVVTNGLNAQPVFAGVPFQNLAIYILCPLGCALLCARLAGGRSWRTAAAVAVAVAALASALAFDLPKLHAGDEIRSPLSAAAAAQLARVRALTVGSAEVVSSYGVVGRFSGRRWVYALRSPNMEIPVRATEVEFVLAPTTGVHRLPAASTSAARAFVATKLQARRIYAGSEVDAYLWHPPSASGTIVVP